MLSMRRVLLCVTAWVLWVSGARADMIMPPPKDCPAGSKGTSTHAGPHCAPVACRRAEDCGDGQRCRGVRLCVAERTYQNRAGHQMTRVIEGTCPDGKCATGTCRTLRVCAEPPKGAGGQGARQPTPAPAPALAGGANAIGDEADAARREPGPSEADESGPSPQRTDRHGCALDSVPVLVVGLLLAAVALLLLWRRRS
jgi:hypothetical protein